MELLHEIIKMNLDGICLLYAKQAPNALGAFEVAMKQAKQIVNIRSNEPNTNSWVPCGQELERLLLGDNIGFQNDLGWIFDRPLIVPTDPKLETRDDLEVCIHWTCTAVIFNNALACHYYGNRSGSDVVLENAMRLYKLSLNMANIAEDDYTAKYAVVHCAAYNNLAHIYYNRSAFLECTDAMDILHFAVMTAEGLDDYLCHAEIENVMLNMVFLASPTTARAA